MMKKFPILISIPHGGTIIPKELKDRVRLEQEDIFDDGDAYTYEIYNLGDKASAVIYTSIARAFVDLNRAPDDLPHINPDGVIKSHTCYGKVIYQSGLEPDENLTSRLLEKYYFPYHANIQSLLDNDRISIDIAFDCHSMASIAPEISPDVGVRRPMICLGNVRGKSCPQEMIADLASCFGKAFSLDKNEISINRPFAGGYITRKYGEQGTPWIQVELNRVLYLQESFFDRKTLSINKNRILELN